MNAIRQVLYRGAEDQARMLELARRSPENHLRVVDLPYRLSSWGLDDPENIGLWVDLQGNLVAWAVMQTPFWTIDMAFHPSAQAELYHMAIHWADGRARQITGTPYGRSSWFAMAFADQAALRGCLEQDGFADQGDVGEDSWSKVFLRRPGNLAVGTYRIPAGFTVRPLYGQAEVKAYVEMHQEVFGSKNMTVEWRERTLLQPDYLPELDVVVEAPDGSLAAFCICWLNRRDPSGITGQVEPLGCRKEFTRYALGRVALAEGLRRLQNRGAQQILVETDNYRDTAFRLYQSMGFEVIRDVRVYRRDYAAE